LNILSVLLAALLLAAPVPVSAQRGGESAAVVRSSPAYAEVLLRKTELLAEVESLSADYTDENPKIVGLRYEVASLEKLIDRLLSLKSSDAGKLTIALGRLMVRRASLDADLDRLLKSYNKDHTDVKRVKKKLEVYDAAIKEILP
jgi:capsule polysaccharide export protein KpsE/RkpR